MFNEIPPEQLKKEIREYLDKIGDSLTKSNDTKFLYRVRTSLANVVFDKENFTQRHHIFDRGDIVLVDFGAFNFGYEVQLVRPAVIVDVNGINCFVIPSSASPKKLDAQHNKFLLKCDLKDSKEAFKESVLMIDSGRWVSKNRIVDSFGVKIDEETMLEVEKRLVVNNRYVNKLLEEKLN